MRELLLGVSLGLGAGLSPGPLLSLVISASLRGGFPAGLRIACVPFLSDLPVVLLATTVVGALPATLVAALSVAGGLYVIHLGVATIRDARRADTPAAGGRRSTLSALDLLRHAPLRRLLVVNWTMSTCWDVHAFVVPILGHERALSASAIGSILGAFAVASVGVRLLIPLVAHRVKEWQVLLGAMAASALVFALYPLSVDAWTMGLCSVLLGTSLGAVQPMVMATLHQVTPHDRQGQALGLRSLTIHASASVMPMLFGAAGAAIGAAPLFWAATALIGVGASRIGGLRRDLEAPSLSPAAPDAAPRG